jgi:hypothetical protein
MTADITELDAHEQPSDELRAKWKTYSKTEQNELIDSGDIDGLDSPEKAAEFRIAGAIPVERLRGSFAHILPSDSTEFQVEKDAPIYYHPLLPGKSKPSLPCCCVTKRLIPSNKAFLLCPR